MDSDRQRSGGEQGLPALPRDTTWATIPDRTTFFTLNTIGAVLAIMCLTVEFAAVYHLMFRGSEEWGAQIVVVSAGGVIASGSLMVARRPRRQCPHCPHCDTDLLESPEDPPKIWCPVCRSIFDLDGQGLPMKEAKAYLYYYLDHPDPVARHLGEILDDAVSSRMEEVRFTAIAESDTEGSAARLAIAPLHFREVTNAALCVAILAEFDRRGRVDSNTDISTLEIVGTEDQATLTLTLGESEEKRYATLSFDYGLSNG